MLNGILLLGPTASGKTPLGEMLEANGVGSIRCHHFDFGNELRLVARDDDNSGYFSDEEIHFINRVLNEGFLLEDGHFHIARKIFMAFTEARGVDGTDITVLNGLPRHAGQAERMADIVDIGLVVNLVCSKDNILCRIEENTGGDRTARKDDHKELVMRKIETYMNRTLPLLDLYRGRGADVIEIEITTGSDAGAVYAEFMQSYGSIRAGKP